MRQRSAHYAVVALCFTFTLVSVSNPNSARADLGEDFVKRGQAAFVLGDVKAMREAKLQYEQALKVDPKNYRAAWHLAEVSYYLWENASGWESGKGNKQEYLLDISRYGVKAGQLAVKLNPDGVEGLFWLSANLGVWGLTNGPLDSLGQVPNILRHTEHCNKLDPQGVFERGGCYRIIAAVYANLPGFPVSIGDKDKAEALYQKSFIKGGGYGINHNLRAELYIMKKDHAKAREILEANLAMMRPRKPYDYYDRRDIKRAEELLKIVNESK